MNLEWETAQLPLYTLWSEASAGTIAFSVAHCTAGDIAIGAGALIMALIVGRERALAQWRLRRIAAWTALALARGTSNAESSPIYILIDALPDPLLVCRRK